MIGFAKTFIKGLPPFRSLVEQRDAAQDELRELRTERNNLPKYVYNHGGMAISGRNVSFLFDERFKRAYQKGMNSGHKIGRQKGSEVDIHIEWRMHMVLWAAAHAQRLPGAFVECGVNTGIYSLAICDFLDFNSLDKDFFLFDTFRGIPPEQMLDSERERAEGANQNYYEECFELVQGNFSSIPRVQLVRGIIPDSLQQVEIERVCFLSIDMNIAAPEVAALEHFWDRMVTGGIIVLDDYAFKSHVEQYEAMNRFAASKGVMVATLPTGQGLILKS